jgi:2-succinyl-5-enolpyruvyl-6-hydroxy-3-cyclohexene-1-carboxylate synthase
MVPIAATAPDGDDGGRPEVSPADLEASRVATMVDEWARAGVRYAVVCPGSRSTPLALALADDERIAVHVRLDERSAAFVALGVGLAGQGPAVLCTTSGTAAAEVHAAVVEAHHAGVPLLVVTADRPGELHDVGAPQTIDQVGLFGGAVRWSAALGPAEPATVGSWRSVAARALAEAVAHPAGPGPVHLNLGFREPLVGRPTQVPTGRPDGAPWHRAVCGTEPTPAQLDAALASLGLASGWVPGVVVAGAGCGDPAAVLGLATALGWPVLADARSGCRTEAPVVVAAADALLRAAAVAAARPAAVVRLGRPWASKVVGAWLDSLPAAVPQVVVGGDWAWPDPGRRAALVVHADPSAWCAGASRRLGAVASGVDRSWLGRWRAAEEAAQHAFELALDAPGALSEPAVARTVVGTAPAGTVVVAASSMPVRDVEWFSPRRAAPPTVVANRGANGIDGVVSTALGVAWTGRRVVALVGDLAFLHDLSAWVRPVGPEPDCTVVVVDNGGGGIFSFLPQASAVAPDRFTELFGTPQVVDVAAAARGLGLRTFEPATRPELAELLSDGAPGLRVVRVRVPDRNANVIVHDELQAAAATAAGAAWEAVGTAGGH